VQFHILMTGVFKSGSRTIYLIYSLYTFTQQLDWVLRGQVFTTSRLLTNLD